MMIYHSSVNLRRVSFFPARALLQLPVRCSHSLQRVHSSQGVGVHSGSMPPWTDGVTRSVPAQVIHPPAGRRYIINTFVLTSSSSFKSTTHRIIYIQLLFSRAYSFIRAGPIIQTDLADHSHHDHCHGLPRAYLDFISHTVLHSLLLQIHAGL